MTTSAEDRLAHRHGRRVHSHAHVAPHRHLTNPRLSRPIELLAPVDEAPPAQASAHEHPYSDDEHVHSRSQGHSHGDTGHGHSHGLIDPSIKRSRAGIRAVALSLAVLGVTALVQTLVFVASGSIALLADLIHNYGDALTAVPLGIAFALRSQRAERYAGLAVVATIFVSACAAGVEAVQRLVHSSPPTHVGALALAGAVGYGGNWVAARIRLSAGRRLDSPALIADGRHASADAYVSLAVIASALAVWLGAPVVDPLIGLVITFVILRITWESWRTVRGGDHAHDDHAHDHAHGEHSRGHSHEHGAG
jgi:Co/Zn/Cd efflux system component